MVTIVERGDLNDQCPRPFNTDFPVRGAVGEVMKRRILFGGSASLETGIGNVKTCSISSLFST